MKSLLFQEGNFLSRERTSSSSKSRKRIHLPRRFLAKILGSFNFEFSLQTIPTILALDMMLEECKELPDFPVMSKSPDCASGAKSLDFVGSGTIQKYKGINSLMPMLCLQPETLLKTRLMFLWALQIFSTCHFIKNKIRHRRFLLNFQNFSPCNFIKNETSLQMFSCEFCKIFQNTYVVNYLGTAASKIWLLLVSFKFLLFIKMENKKISNIIAPEKCLFLFNIFNKSKFLFSWSKFAIDCYFA